MYSRCLSTYLPIHLSVRPPNRPPLHPSIYMYIYRLYRTQADWTFILPSEHPAKELRHLPRKMPRQAYQTSQHVVPCGDIFLGKWPSTFAGSSVGEMNVQSACA
jgi:hypothetical protein